MSLHVQYSQNVHVSWTIRNNEHMKNKTEDTNMYMREYNKSHRTQKNAMNNKWRIGNPDGYKACIKRSLKRTADLVQSIRETTPCHDCGGKFPACVMEFDHREPRIGGKEGTIAYLSRHNSMPKLMAELEKCDVVCANCHRIRTNQRKVNGD